jgi:hypothetical protein
MLQDLKYLHIPEFFRGNISIIQFLRLSVAYVDHDTVTFLL